MSLFLPAYFFPQESFHLPSYLASALILSSYDIIYLFTLKVVKDTFPRTRGPGTQQLKEKYSTMKAVFSKGTELGIPVQEETPACWKHIFSLTSKCVSFAMGILTKSKNSSPCEVYLLSQGQTCSYKDCSAMGSRTAARTVWTPEGRTISSQAIHTQEMLVLKWFLTIDLSQLIFSFCWHRRTQEWLYRGHKTTVVIRRYLRRHRQPCTASSTYSPDSCYFQLKVHLE